MRCLIVDDIKMNLEILGRQLTPTGMQITTVQDGFSALAELERAWNNSDPYPIVILDQMMPGLSGTETARRIRSMAGLAETRLVLLTSCGRHALSGIQPGLFDTILEKPVKESGLLKALEAQQAPRPMAQVTPSTPLPHQVEDTPVVSAAPANTLNILLVEDNKLNQKFAMALLSQAGHRIEVADNGLKAIQAVERSDYDVILMDVQMPEMDGLQATKRIRAMPNPKCAMPIIMLTANAMAGAREQYIAAGANDYVAKPISTDELISKLNNIAGKKRTNGLPPSPRPILKQLAHPDQNSDMNWDLVASVRKAFSAEDFSQYVKDHIADTQSRIQRIKESIKSGDSATAASQAHILISTAGNLGSAKVSQCARAIEAKCRSADRAGIDNDVLELDSAANRASEQFEKLLRTPTSKPSEALG
jgi:CheY-like chemotaxis protein/HPt (histidine-containing phosphotransfer) domain-containing protein